MTENIQQRQEQQADIQASLSAASSSTNAATQMAAQEEEKVYKNHKFLAQLRDSGLDEEFRADLGPLLAGAHVTASRRDDYERYIKWINENEAERELIRNTPGRHLRQRPTMQMIAQETHRRDDRQWTPPMTQDERGDHRNAMEAVTNFQSLAVEGRGIETVGTVQTSTEVTRQTDEEKSLKERVEGVYR
ncbi:hypothetical protein ELS19_06145 [Halogeometricum borinquense]|uniref:Uncharacterized protein n=1 Tax=Halogeometricum borinquense TaxID=60847 RepID=A0A482T9N6_9EURY|nr:hypothetical protein [Halogeometricum borinquense]RYJ13577.1 hypothetical protein ELS19_06145 [Halogeometricum borinquense]